MLGSCKVQRHNGEHTDTCWRNIDYWGVDMVWTTSAADPTGNADSYGFITSGAHAQQKRCELELHADYVASTQGSPVALSVAEVAETAECSPCGFIFGALL
jgi:hypothetical protein